MLDTIAVLEAAYDLRAPEPAWLARVADALAPELDLGLGVMAWTFTIGPRGQELGTTLMRDAPSGLEEGLRAFSHMLAGTADPALTARAYFTGHVHRLLETPGFPAVLRERARRELEERLGARDVVRLSSPDLSPRGVALGAPMPRAPRPLRTAMLARLSAHLTTAYRARTSREVREAVLTPSGGVVDASSAEASAAPNLARLREAARRIDRARGAMRRRDPEGAVGLWLGLVANRWTLVDQHESDGRRYVVARRNEPPRPPRGGLGADEAHVVLRVASGCSQKIIAYELGVSEATVSRRLRRALAKLGLPSRPALIDVLSLLTGLGPGGEPR